MRESNDGLSQRSGAVETEDPLVSFLYELMRDHIPPGKIEKICRESQITPGGPHTLCNGHLARYAQDVADRLRQPKDRLESTLLDATAPLLSEDILREFTRKLDSI